MAKTYELRERADNARDEVDTLGRRLDELAPPEGGILPSSWDLIEISQAVNLDAGRRFVMVAGEPCTVERKIGTYHGDLGKRFAEGVLYNLGGMSAEEASALDEEAWSRMLAAKAELEGLVGNLRGHS